MSDPHPCPRCRLAPPGPDGLCAPCREARRVSERLAHYPSVRLVRLDPANTERLGREHPALASQLQGEASDTQRVLPAEDPVDAARLLDDTGFNPQIAPWMPAGAAPPQDHAPRAVLIGPLSSTAFVNLQALLAHWHHHRTHPVPEPRPVPPSEYLCLHARNPRILAEALETEGYRCWLARWVDFDPDADHERLLAATNSAGRSVTRHLAGRNSRRYVALLHELLAATEQRRVAWRRDGARNIFAARSFRGTVRLSDAEGHGTVEIVGDGKRRIDLVTRDELAELDPETARTVDALLLCVREQMRASETVVAHLLLDWSGEDDPPE